MREYLDRIVATIAVVASFATTRPTNADDLLKPEMFERAHVELVDSASGGCWTNLGESKTYAMDKFTETGFDFEHDISGLERVGDVVIVIEVTSERTSSRCYGHLEVSVVTGLYVDPADKYVTGSIGYVGSQIFSGYDNANLLVLDLIKRVADNWPISPGSSG